MKNRLLLYSTAAIVLLALAITVDRSYKDTQLLQEYAGEIGAFTRAGSAEARQWVEAHRQELRDLPSPPAASALRSEQLALADKPYTVLLFRKDSLLFWSNDKCIPTGSLLSGLDHVADNTLLHLPAGYYWLGRVPGFEPASVAVLMPLRYDAGAGGIFPADKKIPANVQVRQDNSGVTLDIGAAGISLGADGSLQPLWVQAFKLFAWGGLFLLLLLLINRTGLWLSSKLHPLAGLSLVGATILLFYFANNHFGILPGMFSRLPLFAQRFATQGLLGNALGDWLVYTGMLLWAAVFFHRSLRISPDAVHGRFRLPKAFLAYAAMMFGVLASAFVFRQLVLVSGVEVDFGNVLTVNGLSFAALGSIILVLGALFLFSHKLMLVVRSLGLNRQRRMLVQSGALLLLLAVSLLLAAHSDFSLWYVAGFAVLYTAVFDFFIHEETPGFGWVVIWLLLFSLFAAFLLHRFNQQQDHNRRESYALALSENRDTVYAEPKLRALVDAVNADPQLSFLLKPWPFKPSSAALQQYFNQYLFGSNYLFDYFRAEVFAFDRDHAPFVLEQTASWQDIVERQWAHASSITDAPAIRCDIDADGVFRYLLRFDLNRMQDPTQPATVICVLRQSFPQLNRAYARHYFQVPYKGLSLLQRYDYAVLRDGKLAAEQGQNSLAAGSIPMDAGQIKTVRTDNPPREDVVSKSADGLTVAVVGRVATPWYRQIYLFAIIFTLASLVLFALALLNPFVRLLPDYFRFFLSTRGSLARRIHYWNIALIVVAFLVIGVMTYSHFNTTARQNNRAGFDYRTEAILTNLRTQFNDTAPASDSLKKALPGALRTLSSSLSLDANFYAPDGELWYANREDLEGLGLVPARLPIQTVDALRGSAKASLERSEVLAGQPINNKYMPVRNAQNQLLGYLSIPYYFSDRQIGPEVSDFMGMLASLYVFLLLIAGTATLVLARSIIKPIRLISDKIKELGFEDQNQPLEYQGDHSDELGELIEEYNRMVGKLEDSKMQLIRLEREGAWREMARQIAHDIKNPLTTMKLSMQQLERVSNDPMQAAAYLKKAITRLIEQIDSLAQIASEFSMFANLEIRQRQDLVLNDVVESVYDLFTEQKDVELKLDIPKEKFWVSGDKNHMIRVFNNLVINAIQAIPPDRKGQIVVRIFREGGDAIVQIRDNGGGIPPEIQKRVFEPNFTTKSSGSGLGLAICRRIIEALDGTIRFETRESEGTDFFVAMPIVKVD